MPNIKTAKPSMISPTCFFAGAEQNMRKTMPITAMTAVSVSVDKSSSQPEEPPPILERQIIQPVMLVPIIAPMTTPIAWRTFIMPELTKPTTITDVAEDDWITAVTPVPSNIPFKGVLERRNRISSSLLPATFFRLSPMSAMPNRNSAMPPKSSSTFEIPKIAYLL